MRKIIHIDMDAYFASVEQRDHPEWRGIPIAVGFDGERGVVSTASYEARRYGVHSAQSVVVAKRLCPHLLVVPPRFKVYKQVSEQVHAIFHEYTDLVEPLSLDEAFLDVTNNRAGIELAQDIAMEIKQKIREATSLTPTAPARSSPSYPSSVSGALDRRLPSVCTTWASIRASSCARCRCSISRRCLEKQDKSTTTSHEASTTAR